MQPDEFTKQMFIADLQRLMVNYDIPEIVVVVRLNESGISKAYQCTAARSRPMLNEIIQRLLSETSIQKP